MKHLIYYTLLLFILLGCKFLSINKRSTKYSYKICIKNSTGVDMEIQSYGGGRKLDKIPIKDKATFQKDIFIDDFDKNRPYNPGIFSDENNALRDSIFVILGDKKIIKQYYRLGQPDDFKSLFKPSSNPKNSVNNLPRVKRNSDGSATEITGPYKITFTKEDYDAALPIRQ